MPKIAVIDDEPMVGKSLATLLDIRGYDVRIFLSAEKFLDEDRPESFGFLIVDYRLGEGMNGCQLFMHLREIGIDTPAILLTGQLDDDVKSVVRDLPDITLFQKPCPPMRMFRTIDNVFNCPENSPSD